MSYSSSNTPSSPPQETPSSPPMYPNDPSLDCLPQQPKLIPIIPEIKTAIIPQQNQKPTSASPPTPQPPDSPTTEALPVFVPKVIPLERHITGTENTMTRPVNSEVKKPINNNNNNAKHSSKLNSVDIASPDGNIASPDESSTIESPDQARDNASFAKVCTTHIPTTAPAHLFSTRQLISTNEALSNANSQNKSPSSSMKMNSPTAFKSTRSPSILEEDMMNEALTG